MGVHHRNLVSLIGYCNDGENMAVIYEYMANGNLRHHISTSKYYTFMFMHHMHNLCWKKSDVTYFYWLYVIYQFY